MRRAVRALLGPDWLPVPEGGGTAMAAAPGVTERYFTRWYKTGGCPLSLLSSPPPGPRGCCCARGVLRAAWPGLGGRSAPARSRGPCRCFLQTWGSPARTTASCSTPTGEHSPALHTARVSHATQYMYSGRRRSHDPKWVTGAINARLPLVPSHYRTTIPCHKRRPAAWAKPSSHNKWVNRS